MRKKQDLLGFQGASISPVPGSKTAPIVGEIVLKLMLSSCKANAYEEGLCVANSALRAGMISEGAFRKLARYLQSDIRAAIASKLKNQEELTWEEQKSMKSVLPHLNNRKNMAARGSTLVANVRKQSL